MINLCFYSRRFLAVALFLVAALTVNAQVQGDAADPLEDDEILTATTAEDTTFFYEGDIDDDSLQVVSSSSSMPIDDLLQDFQWSWTSDLGILSIAGILVSILFIGLLLLILLLPLLLIALLIWLLVRNRRKKPQPIANSQEPIASSQSHPLAQFRFCPKCGSPQFVPHNGKSKHCMACGFTYYFNPSAATVGLIVNERGEWLCVRRAKEPARGTLDLPGGFSDLYETSEEGVIREVKEETGLTVDRAEFMFSIPNLYEYSGFTVHTIDMFYRCHVKDAGLNADAFAAARAGDDAGELLWLRPEDIRPEDFGLLSIRRGVEKLLEKV